MHIAICCFGGGDASRNSKPCPRQQFDGRRAARIATANVAIEGAARAMALAMEFDFLLDPEANSCIGYAHRGNSTRIVTTCSRPKRAWRVSSPSPRTMCHASLVSAGASGHADRIRRALISWSGSMFEYLMPSLVMRAPAGSLLEQTNRLIVRRQIDYGDPTCALAFGVRVLRARSRIHVSILKLRCAGSGAETRLERNLVIAPYATALAAMIDPRAATRNFKKLAVLGALVGTDSMRRRYGSSTGRNYRGCRSGVHGASSR